MKPIIVKTSKDKSGRDFITMSLTEFEAAIDGAYDAGFIDGKKQVEEEYAAIQSLKQQEIKILPL